MAWRRHRTEQEVPEPPATTEQLDEALAEAQRALFAAKLQRVEDKRQSRTLRRIREENHFAERFGKHGMGA